MVRDQIFSEALRDKLSSYPSKLIKSLFFLYQIVSLRATVCGEWDVGFFLGKMGLKKIVYNIHLVLIKCRDQ